MQQKFGYYKNLRASLKIILMNPMIYCCFQIKNNKTILPIKRVTTLADFFF